jgi:hypothetical protein
MSQKSCPHCGALIDASRTICPQCRVAVKRKNPLVPYVVIGVLVVIIVIAVAVVLTTPVQAPEMPSAPAVSSSSTGSVAAGPTQPTCTVAIAGSRAGSSLRLQVMTSTCGAGEIESLAVSVNGAAAGTMGTTAGTSKTFTGTTGANTVIVTAKFASGAEKIMYQNAAL